MGEGRGGQVVPACVPVCIIAGTSDEVARYAFIDSLTWTRTRDRVRGFSEGENGGEAGERHARAHTHTHTHTHTHYAHTHYRWHRGGCAA